ncbi:MAG TPA: hypothetical protein VFG11_01935 [Acidobacteriota bacterium]|nr:hypothetical protein [Acidobacteriota bacterium]
MIFRPRTLLVCLFVLMVAATAKADTFEYTWKAPDAQPVSFYGKKVAVVVLTKSRAAGIAAEETLARNITLRGADGVPGHNIATRGDMEDKTKAKELFKNAGVVGAIIIQGEPEGKEALDPNVWKDKSFWEAYGGHMNFDDNTAHPQNDVRIYVTTKVYSLEQDKLIWSGTSRTKVGNIDAFIGTILDAVAGQMAKQGLLRRQ